MKKRKDYTVVVIVVLALAAIIAYTVYALNNNKDKHFLWLKTYGDGIREPYDFGVFKALLKNRSGLDFEVIEGRLKDKLGDFSGTDSGTYIFIGQHCFLNRDEIDAMLDFARKGHEVMLIAEGLPDTLLQAMSYYAKPIRIDRFDDNAVSVKTFRDRSSPHQFRFRAFDNDTTTNVDWYFLDEGQQLDYYYGQTGNRYIRQGKINERLNYARFKVGKGFLLIHTSPMLFTNYALRDEAGFRYVDEVFSGVHTGKVMYDVYSREFKEDAEQIHHKSDSPLSYILKQPALRWAWYLFLAAAVLFFVFKAKRKQRIIPVLEQKRNTSIRFIETLSGLFYKNSTHRQMAETRMSLFLFFLRNKLRISTQEVEADTIRVIAVRSKVPEQHIQQVFDYYHNTIQNTRSAVSAEALMEFYNLIDKFYELYNSKK